MLRERLRRPPNSEPKTHNLWLSFRTGTQPPGQACGWVSRFWESLPAAGSVTIVPAVPSLASLKLLAT